MENVGLENVAKSLDGYIADAKRIAIAGHVRPDGDCVGSCLATYNYVKTYYPDVQVDIYLEQIPTIFNFLNRSDEINHKPPKNAESYDLFFAQDCADLVRLGDAAKLFTAAKRTVCIDHHISNQNFAMENYIFPDASSTSELIYELIPQGRMTREIAECVYTGIIHDTGVFQYSCTSKKTMEAAGTLMEMGIDYPGIISRTFFAKTYNQNRIMGLALIKSRLHLDGKCISTVITAAEMKEYDVASRHLEGIVNQILVTRGVEVAIFIYELATGDFKVSTRSASYVDLAKIAVRHGGGGHVRAAGFSMKGNPDDIIEAIVAEVAEQI